MTFNDKLISYVFEKSVNVQRDINYYANLNVNMVYFIGTMFTGYNLQVYYSETKLFKWLVNFPKAPNYWNLNEK